MPDKEKTRNAELVSGSGQMPQSFEPDGPLYMAHAQEMVVRVLTEMKERTEIIRVLHELNDRPELKKLNQHWMAVLRHEKENEALLQLLQEIILLPEMEQDMQPLSLHSNESYEAFGALVVGLLRERLALWLKDADCQNPELIQMYTWDLTLENIRQVDDGRLTTIFRIATLCSKERWYHHIKHSSEEPLPLAELQKICIGLRLGRYESAALLGWFGYIFGQGGNQEVMARFRFLVNGRDTNHQVRLIDQAATNSQLVEWCFDGRGLEKLTVLYQKSIPASA